MTARCTRRRWQGLVHVDATFNDAHGAMQGTARLQSLEVSPRSAYPTEGLEASDLWLVQEALDDYLSQYRGRVGWLDCLQKTASVPGYNLSAAFLRNWPELHRQLDSPRELLLFPYPLDIFDEAQAALVQDKLRVHYARHLGVEAVPGYPFMRLRAP